MSDICIYCAEPLSFKDAAGAMGNTPKTFAHPGCHQLQSRLVAFEAAFKESDAACADLEDRIAELLL